MNLVLLLLLWWHASNLWILGRSHPLLGRADRDSAFTEKEHPERPLWIHGLPEGAPPNFKSNMRI